MYALRSKGKPILEDLDWLWGKEKPLPGKAKRLPGNIDRLSRKTKSESRRIELEPGKMEPSLGKEKPVLGNTNQLSSNVDRLSGKANPRTEPCSGKAESEPSWNQFWVNKTMKNRLLRRVSPGTLGHQ
jgi:hypothetical protein